MNPKLTFRLLNYVLILLLFSLSLIQCSSDGTGVPVFMWGTDGQTSNAVNLNPKSTISPIDSNVLRDDYLKKSQTIIAFIKNSLNVEEFTTEDKNRFQTLNKIMSDQTLEPIFLVNVMNPKEALKDFSVQDINDLNINNENKVIINLPENSLVESDGLIGDLLHKIRQNVSENALFLITGRQNLNPFKEQEEELAIHRTRRNAVSESNRRLVEIKKCLYFYVHSISVYSNPSDSWNLISTFDSLKDKPSLGDSKCWENDGKEPAVLDLMYKNPKANLNIKLMIGKTKKNDFWEITEGKAKLSSEGNTNEYDLIVDDITADNGFSYSCSQLRVLSKIDKKVDSRLRLVFNRFQLQPFKHPNNKQRFVDSFDCQVWMTAPLWMGLITILLFTFIIYIGVYILLKVNTPDRFENPKGKPLIITNTDE